MRPHFKRFFRGMAQKDLLLSDACLPFCGHSLLFFCRRFLFQIKRKCRNAERRYHLIVVGRKGKGKLSTFQNCYDLVSTIVDNGYPRGLPNEVRCSKMGNPQSTGSSGGDGELICRRPHKRRQSRSCLVLSVQNPFTVRFCRRSNCLLPPLT